MNLDLSNMPAVSEVVDGIHSRLDGADGSFSLIDQQLDSITLAVGNAQGDISALSLRADGIDLSVASVSGSVSALSLRADGIDLVVSNNAGSISALSITVGGISTTVSNQAGQISTINQTVSGIQSTVSSHTTTLGTHTSQITQLDNEISSVVSWTDVTGNAVISKITQTATNIGLLADKIDLIGLTRILSSDGTSVTTFDTYGDFYIKYGTNTMFKVYNDISGISLSTLSSTWLQTVGTTTYPQGTWDFAFANIDGISATYA